MRFLPVSLINCLEPMLDIVPLTVEPPRLTRTLLTLTGPSFGSFIVIITKDIQLEKAAEKPHGVVSVQPLQAMIDKFNKYFYLFSILLNYL
mgnify:CR=1 FL=1